MSEPTADEDLRTGRIRLWLPEQDRVTLATLGKLAEEAAELAARASRCIIQGLGERDPDTGRTNSEELSREIADVQACMKLAASVLLVVPDDARTEAKANGFRRWHKMIREIEK